MCLISRRANHFDAKVRAQSFGHNDAAVGLLVVFDDGKPGAADGESAAVESVDEVSFAAAGFGLNRCPAGLVSLEVGAGRDFLVAVLAGEPDFYVVGLCGRGAHVTGAEDHGAVSEAETLQNVFGVERKSFEFDVARFGRSELY